MTQQLLTTREHERPALIVPIAMITFTFAIVLGACGVLSFAGNMPLRVAVQLLGSGLEVMGPAPYFLYAIALALGAWGLLHANNWARRLMIAILAAGVVLTAPHISSAVMDERYLAMTLDGMQILARVAMASYLLREGDWFTQ